MTGRPDPSRDFKAASDRFQQAMADAAEKTTAAEAEATLSAAIEDYNRAVDAYNAHAEQYNREHGLTEDDDAETLRYLVRNGDTATLEAKPGETTGGEQVQPWPRAQRMPLAMAGGRPQPWHHQAIVEYGAATGTELEPNPTIPGGYTATQINWAITWWNERVEAEQPQDGAVGEAAEGIARFLTHFREGSDDTVIEGLGRYCLTVGMLRAVLAEREADTRAVARCQRAKAGPDAVPAMLALDARFADRIAALNSTTTCAFPGCVHPDHQRNAAETEKS